ncbi:MAG: Tat pathway signal protein, partial [Raoultibacter sp.]
GIWHIYTASYNETGLGSPTLVDEGDAENWETPTIAAVGSFAFWQVLPALGGSKTRESSLLKRIKFGTGSDAETIYTSVGRMSTAPYPLADSLVITPRADSTTINYQLTLIDAKSGDVLDKVVLPTSMKPLEAGYGTNGFTFSFDAWYAYGDGIASIGTYTPAEAHGTEDYNNLPWFAFSRTPTAAPAWCNGWFIVKSTRAVCGVDIANKQYFALPVESGCDDYGDYLATTGSTSKFVTFTNVDDTAVDGTRKHYCLVRVWSPVVS